MDMYARQNKNYKYFLVVIDAFSKFVWVRKLKTKSGEEVTNAFASILEEYSRIPVHLQSDCGKEFFNRHFQKLMKKYGINHYNTYSKTKAAMAERVIRTLKEKLEKHFSLNGSYRWIDAIQHIVENYNKTKHSKTKMAPIDVNKSNEQMLLNSVYSNIKIAGKNKLHVGDMVRISKEKGIFSKGYTPNWSTELFKITSVQITNPVTYLLEDTQKRPIMGSFYEHELQKTNQPDVYLVERVLRRKGRKVLVRWLGLDRSHDSWISVDNAFK